MKRKYFYWISILSVLVLLALSSFMFFDQEKTTVKPLVRKWKDLSWMEKTLAFTGSSGLSPEEYKVWYSGHKKELSTSRRVGDINYTVSYIPSEVFVLRDMDSGERSFKELTDSYQGMEYYVFSFQDTLGRSNPFSEKRLDKVDEATQMYMSFDMQKQFWLVSGKDTLPCIQYHYERTIGLSPEFKFMCAFSSRLSKSVNRSLIYQDVLFKHGTVKLTMEAEKLNLSPGIVLK